MLDEKVVLDNANYLYNEICNKEDFDAAERLNSIYGAVAGDHHTMYPPRFDRVIKPRSIRAAVIAIVRAINEAGKPSA